MSEEAGLLENIAQARKGLEVLEDFLRGQISNQAEIDKGSRRELLEHLAEAGPFDSEKLANQIRDAISDEAVQVRNVRISTLERKALDDQATLEAMERKATSMANLLVEAREILVNSMPVGQAGLAAAEGKRRTVILKIERELLEDNPARREQTTRRTT